MKIYLHNSGILSARNVRVYYFYLKNFENLEQIIKQKQEIMKSHIPVIGVIPPKIKYVVPEYNIQNNEPGVFYMAVWIVYDYAEVKDEQFIQILKLNGEAVAYPYNFDKLSIEQELKKIK